MLDVTPAPHKLDRLIPFTGSARAEQLTDAVAASRPLLDGRTVWNVNSTAAGGGVAEMLAQLVAYGLGAGVDTRWLVFEGNPEFFALTKRLHNRLHGTAGDGGPLGVTEHELFLQTTRPEVEAILSRIQPGDLVIVHDPQPAGLCEAIANFGAVPIWRCHIGMDDPNPYTNEGWDFLQPYVSKAHAMVFSRGTYAPTWAAPEDVTVIAPALDPLSAKNAPMSAVAASAILGAIGLLDTDPTGANYMRDDGTTRTMTRRAIIVGDEPRPGSDANLVVQVSRWDRLKDMPGVLSGFLSGVAPHHPQAHLALVGPSTVGVVDDPEGQQVLDDCTEIWHGLDEGLRGRVSLVSLPMDDAQENAAMVNAVQRHASVVAQKSLMEGFGLTVAEAMWKARPMVASMVGGISDQVVDGVTGSLLPDPADLDAFGAAVLALLADPQLAHDFGERGEQRVRDVFLPDRQLGQWVELLTRMAARLQRSTVG